MKLTRAIPAFSCAFMVVYLISMYFHPTFTFYTYGARDGLWYGGVPTLTPRQGPGMYWYSWLTTGLLGGLVGGAIALVTPENIRAKTWSGFIWLVPLILVIILAWIERTWFGFK